MRVTCLLVSLAVVALAASLLSGSSCGTNDDCECFPCGAAIGLTVQDQDGTALDDDWVMAATLDGAAVDDQGACDPDLRTGNSCAFGDATGMYRIVIEAPGFRTREVAARSAVESGRDCCMGIGGCANETQVVVRMIPL